MASETTAAATGAVGVVRRDPMAMLPFCGYHMADYWQHWLDMGKLIKNPPKIFNVNWFRTDDEGHFIWPGFGDNMRVLEWIMARCFDEADAVDSPVGYLPKVEDINLEGSGVSEDTLKDLLTIDKQLWQTEVDGIKEFYKKFGTKLPKELEQELETLQNNIKNK
jgi:phosphoenolpyruvate carboxykinase (GTP)